METKKKNILFLLISLLLFMGLIGGAYYLNNSAVDTNSNSQDDTGSEDQSGTSGNKAIETDSKVLGIMRNEELGYDYLTDKQGNTLYVFEGDGDMVSNCRIKECTDEWPPFRPLDIDISKETDPLTKRLNIFEREDGTTQYAIGQQPLYYYSGDEEPGDIEGNKVGGWQPAIAPSL